MKHLDLFSGIGGFALAASWVWGPEHDIHSFVEIEPFCQKVLKKHWPDTLIHSDIKDYKHDGTAIDLLTGGFPCQPFSAAGEQRGEDDDRYLWPAMLKVIEESKPTWIIGENVAGSINMVIDEAVSQLEKLGYEARPFDIPACAIGADHERRRVWIVANSSSSRNTGEPVISQVNRILGGRFGSDSLSDGSVFVPAREGAKAKGTIFGQPIIRRIDDGVSTELDEGRLKGLGNAIVPQVVVPIMQAIKELK